MSWLRDHIGKVLLGAIVLLSVRSVWVHRQVHHAPGVLVAEEPLQEESPPSTFTFKNHLIWPLATFDIRARVLGTESYYIDRASKLSPLDLCLGWGSMSDSRVLDQLDIDQAHRWWLWTSSTMPLSEEEVNGHAANMHMIPAQPSVERTLSHVRVGQIVHLRGKLVRAKGDDGFDWRSSLSRADRGDGACEVVFVEEATASDN